MIHGTNTLFLCHDILVGSFLADRACAYSHANLLSKLVKQMAKACSADMGYW